MSSAPLLPKSPSIQYQAVQRSDEQDKTVKRSFFSRIFCCFPQKTDNSGVSLPIRVTRGGVDFNPQVKKASINPYRQVVDISTAQTEEVEQNLALAPKETDSAAQMSAKLKARRSRIMR